MPALLTVAGNVLIRHPACRILIDRPADQNEPVGCSATYLMLSSNLMLNRVFHFH